MFTKTKQSTDPYGKLIGFSLYQSVLLNEVVQPNADVLCIIL